MNKCNHPAGKCNNTDDCAKSICLHPNNSSHRTGAKMTDERFKQIMRDLGMPDSRSLLQALRQVANETEQEVRASFATGNRSLCAVRDGRCQSVSECQELGQCNPSEWRAE